VSYDPAEKGTLRALAEESELTRRPALLDGHRGPRQACEKLDAGCSVTQTALAVRGIHVVLMLVQLELELELKLGVVALLMLEEEGNDNCPSCPELEDELMVVG
jgi:hypothetical protein